MNKVLLFIILSLSLNCLAQQDKFIIKEYINDDSMPFLTKDSFSFNSSKLFEDSLFSVSSICLGEWGGIIIFKSKQTGIEYVTTSTCPIVVHKMNNKYYVTNALAHMMGYTSVIEIADPVALPLYKPSKKNRVRPISLSKYGINKDFNYEQGRKTLVDSHGILSIASFPYHGQFYHIIKDHEYTYIAKIKDGNFETIDTLLYRNRWDYFPRVFETSDRHFVVFFEKWNWESNPYCDTKGYIDIYENKITIVWCTY